MRFRAQLDTSNEQDLKQPNSLVRNDLIVAETVCLLLENGMQLPDVLCQRDVLHELLLMEFPNLLRVLAGHGVDIWISDEINDKPLTTRCPSMRYQLSGFGRLPSRRSAGSK